MKKMALIGLVLGSLGLTGCLAVSKEESLDQLQMATAYALGLMSSDEVKLSDTKKEDQPLGAYIIRYKATTRSGRVYICSSHVLPGILLQDGTVSRPECKSATENNYK